LPGSGDADRRGGRVAVRRGGRPSRWLGAAAAVRLDGRASVLGGRRCEKTQSEPGIGIGDKIRLCRERNRGSRQSRHFAECRDARQTSTSPSALLPLSAKCTSPSAPHLLSANSLFAESFSTTLGEIFSFLFL
jgi:hypothetical protein